MADDNSGEKKGFFARLFGGHGGKKEEVPEDAGSASCSPGSSCCGCSSCAETPKVSVAKKPAKKKSAAKKKTAKRKAKK